MVNHFVRDSFLGRFVNKISNHRILPYPEELSDYIVPEKYLDLPKQLSDNDAEIGDIVKESAELGDEQDSNNTVIKPEDDGIIMVDWEENDPENPYNWPFYQKIIVLFEVALLTVSVYIGAAIYTPGVEQIMEKFEISQVKAVLPLTLFVIGYGIGPMVLSPITENATIGRCNVYGVTLFIFFILQIPTALINNYPGLCVLRVLAGFFASPALSTAGATIGDVLAFPYMPVGLGIWAIGGISGPSLGPLIGAAVIKGGESVDPGNGWRWPFWFLAMISGTAWLVLSWFLPETFAKTLLYRKAERLRKLTGNMNITSQGHLDAIGKTFNDTLLESLWRPIEITVREPVVLLINLHITLVYAIIYLWFEAFPIVFTQVHGFGPIQLGLTYIVVSLGVNAGSAVYVPYMYKSFTIPIMNGAEFIPEVFIPPSFWGSFLCPIGVLIFGWTASPDFHWFPPLIGAFIFSAGSLIIFQTEFNYLGANFYRFIASTFASNALFRSVIGGVFPLFATSLFNNTGTERFPVGWGCTIIGFIALAMCGIPGYFWYYGPQLRAKSKYAGNE